MAKVIITLKDPDTMYDAVKETVDEEIKAFPLEEDEKEAIREVRIEKYSDIVGEFFEYGEYLTIEVDTETKEARVISASELEKIRER